LGPQHAVALHAAHLHRELGPDARGVEFLPAQSRQRREGGARVGQTTSQDGRKARPANHDQGAGGVEQIFRLHLRSVSFTPQNGRPRCI